MNISKSSSENTTGFGTEPKTSHKNPQLGSSCSVWDGALKWPTFMYCKEHELGITFSIGDRDLKWTML